MAKEDAVQGFVQAIQDGEKQLLSDKAGELYDGAKKEGFDEGAASVPPTSGGDPSKIYSQADLDAAVVQAKADQQGLDAAALNSAIDAAKADHDALQAKVDDMTSKEQAAEGVVKDLQDKLTAAKASFDAVFAFLAQMSPQPPASGSDSGGAEPVQPQALARPKFDPKHD